METVKNAETDQNASTRLVTDRNCVLFACNIKRGFVYLVFIFLFLMAIEDDGSRQYNPHDCGDYVEKGSAPPFVGSPGPRNIFPCIIDLEDTLYH